MGLRTSSNSVVYDYGYDKVFEAARSAIADCKFRIKQANEKTGEISASAGISLISWGENISISISNIGKNKTRVSAYSGAKAQIIDWGKSEKNIYLFFAALDRQLSK